MQACRCGGVDEWRRGALETRRRRREVSEFASRALEMRCRRCLKRGMEIVSSAGTLQARCLQVVSSSSVLFVVVGISSFRSSRQLGQNACGFRRPRR